MDSRRSEPHHKSQYLIRASEPDDSLDKKRGRCASHKNMRRTGLGVMLFKRLAYLPILTGFKFHICAAYSLIVRSEENLPMLAVLMIAIRAQRFLSLNALSASS